MERIKHRLLDVVFLLGERLALILVFLVAGALLFTKSSVEAFSQADQPPSIVLAGLSFQTTPNVETSEIISPPTPTPTASPTPTSTPTPTATPTPTQPTATPTPTIDPNDTQIWDKIASCESDGNWHEDSGNGYFGGLQFSQGAWDSVGGGGKPSDATREDQIAKGKTLQGIRGWGVWGACAHILGLD